MSESTQFEFAKEQDEAFDRLGYKMQGVGTVGMLLGLFSLLLGGLIFAGLYTTAKMDDPALQEKIKITPATMYALSGIYVVSGLIYLSMGFWTRSAGSSFRAIVTTEGNDITLLTSAVNSLHKLYSLLYSMILVGLLLFVGSIILGVVVSLTK